MKKLLLLLLAFPCLAQPLPPSTTPFTRTFLRSADAPTAVANLGIATSNWVVNSSQLQVTAGNAVQIKSGAVVTNLNGSVGVLTNILNAPTTLWVATNASGNTGLRGQISAPFSTLSAAVTAASPGDTIQVLGTVIVTNAINLTNLTVQGGTIIVSNRGTSATLNLVGSKFIGCTISNMAPSTGNSVVIGGYDGTSGTIDSCRIYGSDYGVQFEPSAASTNVVNIRNTYIKGVICLDTWRQYYNIEGCHLDGFSQCVTLNDNSTNYFNNTTFVVGPGSGSSTYAVVHYGASYSTMNNCSFALNPATTSDANIIWPAEASYGIYNNCSFEVANPIGGAPVLMAVFTTEIVNLFFNGCYYRPTTNNVLFSQNNQQVRVSGGNFIPANFSQPNKVVWDNAAFNSVTLTNLNAIGGAITNNSIVWLSSATATNTTTYPDGSIATAGGKFWVLQSGTWVQK